jgi:hypothetical protein
MMRIRIHNTVTDVSTKPVRWQLGEEKYRKEMNIYWFTLGVQSSNLGKIAKAAIENVFSVKTGKVGHYRREIITVRGQSYVSRLPKY